MNIFKKSPRLFWTITYGALDSKSMLPKIVITFLESGEVFSSIRFEIKMTKTPVQNRFYGLEIQDKSEN